MANDRFMIAALTSTGDRSATATGLLRRWAWFPGVGALLIPAVLAAAFLVYTRLWPAAPVLTLDTPSYQRLAKDLRDLHISRLHERTPGYPLLMALAGAEEHLNRSLFYASLAIHLAAAALLAYVLYRLRLPLRAIALFIGLAILPPFVEPSAYATTESLCQFSMVLSYAAFLWWLTTGRFRAVLPAAAAAAYAALVRPTCQALFPLLAACAVVSYLAGWTPRIPIRRLLAHMACGIALFYSILGGYAWLNYRATGVFGTSTISGLALSTKVATVIEFLPDEYAPLREILVRHRDRLITKPFDDHTGQDYIFRAIPELRAYYHGDDRKMLREVEQASLYLIRSKPMSYLHESGKVLMSYWMPVDYPLSAWNPGFRALWALLQLAVNATLLLSLAVLAGAGLFCASARLLRRATGDAPELYGAFLTGAAVILYTMVISCFVGIGISLYRVPTDYLILATLVLGYAIWRRGVNMLRGFPPSSPRPER